MDKTNDFYVSLMLLIQSTDHKKSKKIKEN